MSRRSPRERLATTVLPAVVAALVMTGCRSEEDDAEPAILPKPVAFEGQVDSRFVGAWATADGGSKLDLRKDGTLKIASTGSSRGGKTTSEFDGKWLVSGKNLLLRYTDNSGETTLEYAATLSGNTLNLQQPGGRMKMKYVRK